ncbi:MAG: DNA-methyltransferase [Bacillota bacterium]
MQNTHHKFYLGNVLGALRELPDESVHCCITSPPYFGLRDYGLEPTHWPAVEYSAMAGLPPVLFPEWDGCLGLEPTPEMYVAHLVLVFLEVKRVLRKDGNLWLNLGDSYVGTGGNRKNSPNNGPNSVVGPTATANMPMQGRFIVSKSKRIPRGSGRWGGGDNFVETIKPKDLIGIPWRVALALQADGWYLRSDIIWSKTNPMPESVTDRPTKAHEYIFLLSKCEQYYYDYEAIKEPVVYSGPNNGVGFGHGTDREKRARDRVRGSKAVINNPPNSALRKSGNKERKYGELIGALNTHLGRSFPWEGDTRNKRSVWTISTEPSPETHFATFPSKLVDPCIMAGSPEGGTILDPFGGTGTTSKEAKRLYRNSVYIDLNPTYLEMAINRMEFPVQELFTEHSFEVMKVIKLKHKAPCDMERGVNLG